MNNTPAQVSINELYKRAESAIAVSPEEFTKTPIRDTQKLIHDLSVAMLGANKKVEQLTNCIIELRCWRSGSVTEFSPISVSVLPA